MSDAVATLATRLSDDARRLEPDFVKLAGGLAALASNAGKVAELGARLAGQVEAHLAALRATGLGKLIGEAHGALRTSLADADARITRLCANADLLRALAGSGKRMRALATELCVIRLGISIETARLNGQNAVEFRDVVAQLVEVEKMFFRLGGLVAETADEGANQQKLSVGEISKGLVELSGLAGRCERVARSAAASVDDLMHRFGSLANEVAEAVSTVRKQTQEIVYFLQIGDIVRQKVEHVAEALARGEVEPARIARVLTLQTAQLDRVVADLESAHEKLGIAFRGLDGSTSRVIELLIELTASADHTDSGPSFAALLDDARSIESLRTRANELGGLVARAAENADVSAKGILEHLAQVKRVNTSMQMKAQNAIIKTARIGDTACALGVLSAQVFQVAKSSGTLVTEVMPRIEQLRCNVSAAGESTQSGTESQGNEVEQGLAELDHLRQEVSTCGVEASQLANAQQQALAAAQRNIEFLPEVRQRFAAAVGRMRELLAMLGPVSMSVEDQNEALSAYTMESEREVHRAMLGANGAKEQPAAAPSESDLGDNVELF